MPDADGKLTEEEKQTIIAWLNQRGKNHACSVCQENSWTVGDHLLFGMVDRRGAASLGGAYYPQFFLSCNNCYYTRHFMAAQVLGLKKTEPKEKAEKEPKKASGGGSG